MPVQMVENKGNGNEVADNLSEYNNTIAAALKEAIERVKSSDGNMVSEDTLNHMLCEANSGALTGNANISNDDQKPYVIYQELQEVKIKMVAVGAKQYRGKVFCNSPLDCVDFMRNELAEFDREMVAVMNLNSQNRIINFNFVSMGTLNASNIEPREFFKSAVLSNAAAVIAVHNHPSGNSQPSESDINVTKRLFMVGEICGIPLIDHVIIGSKEYEEVFSFRAHNMMPNPKDFHVAEVLDANKVGEFKLPKDVWLSTKTPNLVSIIDRLKNGKQKAQIHNEALKAARQQNVVESKNPIVK